MVRSMLSDFSLSKKFCAEALSTAGYIRNRSPTAAVEEMTPYEAFNGERRTFSTLQCLHVMHMLTFQRMSETNLIQSHRSTFVLAMAD